MSLFAVVRSTSRKKIGEVYSSEISNVLVVSFVSLLNLDGGDNRDRTDDLYAASVALSQLSYTPTIGR